MVHLTGVAVGFSAISGLVSLGLGAFALRAARGTGNPSLRFLAAAFVVFAAKSFVVAYAVWSHAIEHEDLELVDAAGDLATILLFAMPLVRPGRPG